MKILILTCLIILPLTVFSQTDKLKVYSLSFETSYLYIRNSNKGISLKPSAQYKLGRDISVYSEFLYCFTKDESYKYQYAVVDFGVKVNQTAEQIAYVKLGLGGIISQSENSGGAGGILINLGIGREFNLSRKAALFIESNALFSPYRLSGFYTFGAGLKYSFY
ncbi:MAG: hypothetical protein PHN88_01400 [Ignavibacteria bacterium]|nr:hypothetical protein [Ignavibacteria bacterium]